MVTEINLLPKKQRRAKPYIIAAAVSAALASGLFGLIRMNREDKKAAAETTAAVATVTGAAAGSDDPILQALGARLEQHLRELSALLETIQPALNDAKKDPAKFERFLEQDVDAVAQKVGLIEAETQNLFSRLTVGQQQRALGTLIDAKLILRELQQLHADAQLFKSYLVSWRSRVNNMDRMYRANPDPLSFAVAMSTLLRNAPTTVTMSKPEHADIMLALFRQQLSDLSDYVLAHRTRDRLTESELEVLRDLLKEHRRDIERLPAFKNFLAVLTAE